MTGQGPYPYYVLVTFLDPITSFATRGHNSLVNASSAVYCLQLSYVLSET